MQMWHESHLTSTFIQYIYFYDGAIAISPLSYEPAIPETAFLVNSAFTGMLK